MEIRSILLVALCGVMGAVAPLGAKPGDYAEIGEGGWSDAPAMVAMDGSLWIIDDGRLYKVDKTGKYAEIGEGGWSDAPVMAAMDGSLWIIDDRRLYRVTTK